MKHIFLCLLLCLPVIANAGEGKKPVEKLGVAKLQEFHMTKKQVEDANKSVAESFEQGFKNSDPEVQKAIVKAAKELDAKKKAATKKSAE